MMEMVRLDQEDQKSTGLLNAYVKDKGSLTEEQSIQLAGYVQAYFYEIASKYGQEFARGAVEDLLSGARDGREKAFLMQAPPSSVMLLHLQPVMVFLIPGHRQKMSGFIIKLLIICVISSSI